MPKPVASNSKFSRKRRGWENIIVGLFLFAGHANSDSASTPPKTLSVSVQDTRLVDATGKTVQLRGVNVSGLEFTAAQGWSPNDPWGEAKPRWPVIQDWKANVVRFPLNEASWLGYKCVVEGKDRNPDPGHNYRATVIQAVHEANAAGLYVILELHWSAPGTFCPLGQNPAPDTDHSIDFWKSMAETFKDNPSVIFELFNEPFLSDQSKEDGALPPGTDVWKLWLEGGKLSYVFTPKKMAYTWTSAGMQQLIDTIRATRATNIILVGGNVYSNDLTGWPTHTPHDPLHQLAAAWHAYRWNFYNRPDEGETRTMLGNVITQVPLIITEVGDKNSPGTAGAPFASSIVTWADAHGISYLGWTWDVWKEDNVLIKDKDGTPSDGFGVFFKDHLQKAYGP